MKLSFLASSYVLIVTSLFLLGSCNNKSNKPKEVALTIAMDSAFGLENAATVRENITATVADGLELTLWASDSLAPDPVAMDIDKQGRIYITRTNRQKHSEFDIRGYRQWMTPSIALQSVEDRRAFLHKTFATDLSEENSWLKDLNNDSIHDWKDFTVEKDEVWMLEDTNGDGLADQSTRILEDFNTEITDVAGALLVRDEDVFVGIGPDMWRLTDTNDDGVLDEKISIAHGFAVHIGFGGHGMSGLIQGPDGKIYWGIGDIGANITTVDGVNHKYPNQGVIVRCNPDGSDFEVFSHGHRNTHEFVFDAYGNIISSDNDGDHAGESERLVHIVEGSDSGWRTNWQFGKYTDPKNNGYKVWMDEKLFVPRWEGQAAYIIPPIMNFHNGPTGMAYNPGTGLGKDWQNRFFLSEFVGDPSRSHIWSFDLKPKGASFDLNTDIDVVSGILPTGVRFGPDGALYTADWIRGWDTKNYGRVWKIDVSEDKNDLVEERQETQRLMTLDYSEQSTDELMALLSYPDMRIRQKAQFELAKSTFWGYRAMKDVLMKNPNQFTRIHAIWGIGQIAAKDMDKADCLVSLLSDSDSEIIVQSLKVLGDIRYKAAGAQYIPLLKHESDRVKFFAAQALGRIAKENAVQPLLDMIAMNNDIDVYLRHAGVLALSRIGKAEPMVALASNPNRSLRIAAVLVLRRMQNAGVAKFLNDSDEYIVTEAARAINDDWSIQPALPALANLLTETRFTSEPLLRRAINAALRVGGEKELGSLIAFAKRKEVNSALRGEALAAIGTWGEPSVLDRVDGRFRGKIKRDASIARQKIGKEIPELLTDENPEILIGVSKTLEHLAIADYNKELFTVFAENKSPRVRAAMLSALGALKFKNIETVMKVGMADNDQEVRRAAVALLSQLEIPKENLSAIVNPIFRSSSVGEQQTMLSVLAEMPIEKSEDVLQDLIRRAANKSFPEEATLDLIEAVEASGSANLIAQLQQIKKSTQTTEGYRETLYGGNWWQGQQVFSNNPTAQCVRCHAVNGVGGEVGPPLGHVADLLTREQLLEALIEPSKRIAPGYGSVTLTLLDGQVVTGVLEEETKDELILRTNDAEPMKIAHARIKKRENGASAMPAVGRLITKRELRDLIEYLSSLGKHQL